MMESRVRQDLVKTINNDLLEMGSTGKSDELIKLTAKIVTNTKKLLIDGVPEELVTKTTASLTKLVLAAKSIAQNPTVNFSEKIKHLSEVRRFVDGDVKQLDKFISTPRVSELKKTKPVLVRSATSPPPVTISNKERRLTDELKSLYKTFVAKKEVQKNPPDTRERPEDSLKIVVAGIGRAVSEIEKAVEMPVKEVILEPVCLLCRMISKLLDTEDCLFINRFPMRAQVFEFTDVIVSTTLKSNKDSRQHIDQGSVKVLRTQISALLQAVEVVVEQCYVRTQSLEASWQQSIKRKKGLDELDSSKSPSPELLLTSTSPEPSKPKSTATFAFTCVVCSSTGYSADSDSPIIRGTELSFRVPTDISLGKLKNKIRLKTSIPVSDIQLCQGQDVVPEAHVFSSSGVPYFLFNVNEPSEEETKEIQKQQRRRHIRLEDIDWSSCKGPMALALYDYDTEDKFGEDGNLSFFEGEIIEVLEKSHDGWWEGKVHGQTGVFPASFVLELQRPSQNSQHHLPRSSVQLDTKPQLGSTQTYAEEVYPEAPERSRAQSVASGFIKRPFRKRNKDSPKPSPKVPPDGSPNLLQQRGSNSSSPGGSPLVQHKHSASFTSGSLLKPKRPPPPVPPPYGKRKELDSKLQGLLLSKSMDAPAIKSVDNSEIKQTDVLKSDKEDSIGDTALQASSTTADIPSMESVLEPSMQSILEDDIVRDKPSLPVAPPRRKKKDSPFSSPKLANLRKAPSAPAFNIAHSNGHTSSLVARDTVSLVVAVCAPTYTAEELEKCTDVGKSGYLHEGGMSGDWHKRLFHLERDRLVYKESGGLVTIGEVLLSTIKCATELNAKYHGFYCVAVHLKDEKSVLLGTSSVEDKRDWAISINKAVTNRAAVIFEIHDHLIDSPAYLVAMECISFLRQNRCMKTDRIFRMPGNVGKLKKYLDAVDSRKKPSLEDMSNPNTAASLLKSMFKNDRIDFLVPSEVVNDMCTHVQRNAPVSGMRDLIMDIPEDKGTLLAALIKLFALVVEQTDKNHTDVTALDKVFGSAIFQHCPPGKSESLLAYLISTNQTVLP